MAVRYEDVIDIVDIIAKDVARDWPDIDWQDVRQEIALFIVQHGKSIKTREEGGNPRRIFHLVGMEYAKKLRTQYMVLSPQYAYRPSDIIEILETAYIETRTQADYVPDDARHPLSKTFNVFDKEGSFVVQDFDEFHETDFIEVASDVKAVVLQLKPELKESIFRRFVLKEIPDNNSYERKRLNKAVNELTRKLNWYRGGNYARRKVMSNAGARAEIGNSYDGR